VRNVRLYVLDERMQLLPRGVAGEIYIGGSGLSLGYLDQPEVTADRFRPDPFAEQPGARLYRSGDRVREGAAGLEFLGRVDQQLKVRGVRVEAGEIERVLRSHPAVRAAVVARVSDGDDGEILAAYIVGAEVAPSEGELRAHLLTQLPRAVLPTAYCVLSELPVTANGKIDRRRLPPPSAITQPASEVAPRSETERLLVAMWTDVLGVASIGVTDDFFAAGGHSLAAARLAARLRDACAIDVPVRELFVRTTIAEMAEFVDAARRRAVDEAALPPLVPRRHQGPIPLSFAQQGFWLLEQFEGARHVHVNVEIVRLRGALSVPALARALTIIVGRHEALRTTFATDAGRASQIVGPPFAVDVPVIDLQGLSARNPIAVAARVGRAEGLRAFDLRTGPLVRIAAIRLAADDHILVFAMHHLIADGWSMTVLLNEVNACYSAALGGTVPRLPALTIQYGDYTEWQRARWSDQALAQAVARRRAQLGELGALHELPTDRPRPSTPSFSGGRHPVPLDADLVARARHLARREGLTLFMMLVAALEIALHLLTGDRAVAVAVPAANRIAGATEPLIGLFINHVVVVTRFDGAPTCRELLRRSRVATLDALDDQDLPFDALVRGLAPERHGRYTPITRSLLSLLNVPPARLALPGLRLESAPFGAAPRPRFDLEWMFTEAGTAVSGVLGYDRDLFDAATTARLAADYVQVLQTIVDAPDTPVSALSAMTGTQASLAQAFSEPL
jgi:hypothetical protein